MSNTPGFVFFELNPATTNSEILKHAATLINENVWGIKDEDSLQIDTNCAVQLVAAVTYTGEVAAAGTMEIVKPNYFYITEIATDEHYRQKYKLGSRILAVLEDMAKGMGAKEVALSALSDSRTFFEKNGYQPDPTPNISSLGMRKIL